MADSNVAAAPAAPSQVSDTFVSKASGYFWYAYESYVAAMMAVIYVCIQPYVFSYNLAKSIFENFRDLITIGALSIRAAQLYLQVWIRFLNGLNKDDKPAETVINTMKNIGTATNNIYKKLLDEPGSSSPHRPESGAKGPTFPPIPETNEQCDGDSGDHGANGHPAARTGSPPIDADPPRAPRANGVGGGGGGGNGGSGGSGGGSNGSNGSATVNGHGKHARGSVAFEPTVQLPVGGQGVDEVDKAKPSPKQTPASGGATYASKV